MSNRVIVVGVVVALLSVGMTMPAYAQKLVFVVRHAERADGGAMQMQAQTDPPLSAAGEARALKLAKMLGDAGIQAIFATEYRRTQDTAKPLATKLGLTIRQFPLRDTAALLAALRKDAANDIVLIIGHSNTVPAILKALGGSDVAIADDEYDNLFVLVPATGAMTRIRFAP
jgi:broad specificity phosphatase PhoE